MSSPPVAPAFRHRTVDPQQPPQELSGLAWGVFVSLGVLAVLAVVRMAVGLKLHSAVTNEGDIKSAYDTYSIWVGIFGVAILVSAGVFIAWFFRAYRNLRRLGVQNMRYGNGWAIGAWFIPILGMVRPKQIANDVWRGSERGVEVSAQWQQVTVPNLVHWWWGLFLVQGLLVYIGQRMVDSGYNKLTSFGSLSSGLSQIKSGTVVDISGDVLAIAAVVLAIMVVSQISERLDAIRSEVLAAAPAAPPTPTAFAPPAPTAIRTPPPPAPPAVPPMPPPPVVTPTPPPAPAQELVRCPECAEWIQPQAKVCRFCGHRFQPPGQ